MKGSEIDDPGHLIGLKPRRFPNWGARQQPIKICPLCFLTYEGRSFVRKSKECTQNLCCYLTPSQSITEVEENEYCIESAEVDLRAVSQVELSLHEAFLTLNCLISFFLTKRCVLGDARLSCTRKFL